MTPFRSPAQPHFLVHRYDAVAINSVAFPMHSIKKLWSLPDHKSTHLRICLSVTHGTSSILFLPDDIHHLLINLPQVSFFL